MSTYAFVHTIIILSNWALTTPVRMKNNKKKASQENNGKAGKSIYGKNENNGKTANDAVTLLRHSFKLECGYYYGNGYCYGFQLWTCV